MKLEHEIKHAARLLAREQYGEPCQFSTNHEANSSEQHDDESGNQQNETEKCLESTGLGIKFTREFSWLTVWFGAEIGKFVKHVC